MSNVTWNLLVAGMRVHRRTPMTLATIAIGFAAAAFMMAVIWTGNAAFGHMLLHSGRSNSLLILAHGADTVSQSRLDTGAMSSSETLLLDSRMDSVVARTVATGSLTGPKCAIPVSVSVIASEPLSTGQYMRNETTPEGSWVDAGAAITRRCGLEAGGILTLNSLKLDIKTIRSANDSVDDSSLIVSPATIRAIFGMDTAPNALIATGPPEEIERLQLRIASDETKRIRVIREDRYYARQSGQLLVPTIILSVEIGGLMVIGALLAVLLSMQTAIASRIRELSTLLVIGFSRLHLCTALALEAAVIAAVGANLGLAAACLIFAGKNTALFDAATNGQVLVSLVPTTSVFLACLLLAASVGAAATFLLAARSLRELLSRLFSQLKSTEP